MKWGLRWWFVVVGMDESLIFLAEELFAEP